MTDRWAKTFVGMAIVFLFLLSGSCASHKNNVDVTTTDVIDTLDIEVRHQYYYITDTVRLSVPLLTSEHTTTDSASVLENDLAISEARINEDGSLYHDLRTKPQEIPMPVTVPAERHDSIIYKTKIKYQVKYKDRIIEKEPSRWVEAQAWGFRILFPLLIGLTIWTFRKQVIKLIFDIFKVRN